MVEAKVRLGLDVSTPTWSIGISSADDGAKQKRTCEIWLSKSNGALKPGIHMFMGNAQGSSGAWDPGFSIAAAEGESFILQSFGTVNTHTCRLISADSTKQLSQLASPTVPFTFSGPGSVTAYTSGRSAAFDYVRVFQVP
jgi:hypothetical protein